MQNPFEKVYRNGEQMPAEVAEMHKLWLERNRKFLEDLAREWQARTAR